MVESSSSSSSPTEEIVRLIKRLSAYVAFKMSSLFSTSSIRNLIKSLYNRNKKTTQNNPKRSRLRVNRIIRNQVAQNGQNKTGYDQQSTKSH